MTDTPGKADAVSAMFTTELFDLLGETFYEVQGYYLDRGTSLFETLEPITAELASRPVSSRCANLAAQVNHVTYYLDVLTRAVQGEEITTDWDGSWQVGPVSADEWAALKTGLREQVERTMAVLRAIGTWDGEDQMGGALNMVVHTAYHLGEIRQALCTLME